MGNTGRDALPTPDRNEGTVAIHDGMDDGKECMKFELAWMFCCFSPLPFSPSSDVPIFLIRV